MTSLQSLPNEALRAANDNAVAKAADDLAAREKTVEKLQDEITGHIELEGKLQYEIVTLTLN